MLIYFNKKADSLFVECFKYKESVGIKKMKKSVVQILEIPVLLILAMGLLACSANIVSSTESTFGKSGNYEKNKETVELKVWTYYAGMQQEAFQEALNRFNEGRGKDIGIEVKAENPGSIQDLENNIYGLSDKNLEQGAYPDMITLYPDTAMILEEEGLLTDLDSYFNKEEWSNFVPSFLEEGRLGKKYGGVKILPVAKSTELLFINKTAWDKFAEATGSSLSELDSREGVLKVSERYFHYTDSLTEKPDDGKAFYGMDDLANYMLIGAKELGAELISVDEDGKAKVQLPKEVLRTLWDNFYVPYIKGYYASYGRFRSDDVKTGMIIAYTGSSVSSVYFPKEVILSDSEQYPITCTVLQNPYFKNGEQIAAQQGAGIGVIKGNEKRVEASIQFLKWLTGYEENSRFAMSAEYLPVRRDNFTVESIDKEKGKGMDLPLEKALSTMSSNTLYFAPGIVNLSEIRKALEFHMKDKALADRVNIETAMASGLSWEDAVAEYDNDENFEIFYEDLLSEIEYLQSDD